jgi:hypothetical protein
MARWDNGDFNDDGIVNGSDYRLIENNFNTQWAILSSQIWAADPKPTVLREALPIIATSASPPATGFGNSSTIPVRMIQAIYADR